MAEEPIACPMSSTKAIVVVVLLWFGHGLGLVILDWLSAFTLFHWACCVLATGAVGAAGLFVLARSSTLAGLAAVAVPLLVLAAVRWGYWPPRKDFLLEMSKVKPGMDFIEVAGRLSRFPEGTGWSALDGGELRVEGAHVFRADHENSDWAVVRVDGGVICSVEIWYD